MYLEKLRRISLVLLFLSILVPGSLKSQIFSDSDVLGTWKITRVRNISDDVPADKLQMAKMLSEVLMNARFVFGESNRCNFTFPLGGRRFKDVYWKYNSSASSIVIQDWAKKDDDRYKLLELFVVNDGTNVSFRLPQFFITLEVARQD